MPFCNRTKIAEAYAREDGIEYRYILEEERLFGVKTYSVSVYMIFCGKESFCRIESIAADKALSDVDLIIGILVNVLVALFRDVVEVRLCILVGTNHLQSRKQNCVNSAFQKVVCYHVGGDYLTLCKDNLFFE